MMNQLDQALEAFLRDEEQQERYYQLILASDFYIPLQEDHSDIPMNKRESVRPLLLQAERKHYMLLFDSEDRLAKWAKQPMHFAILSGDRAAALSTPELHWAVNVGSDFAKEFVPEEISHLQTLTSSDEIAD